MDFKKILGDELVKKLDEASITDEVINALGAAKLIQNDEGEFIPQAKFSEKVKALNVQIDELNKQLETRTNDYEELEKKVKAGANAADELEKLKAKHKEDTETLKKQLQDIKLESAIETALLAAKIKKPTWAKHLVNELMRHSDKLVEVDGKYPALNDLVNGFKESDDYKEWFGEVTVNGDPPDPSNPKDKNEKELADLRKQKDEAMKKGDMRASMRLDREIAEKQG
jgi:chromosome segregation ATPase